MGHLSVVLQLLLSISFFSKKYYLCKNSRVAYNIPFIAATSIARAWTSFLWCNSCTTPMLSGKALVRAKV